MNKTKHFISKHTLLSCPGHNSQHKSITGARSELTVDS